MHCVSSVSYTHLDVYKRQVEESKDVIVDKDDTIIKDQVIEGDLIISEKVGDGEVTVKDTTVKGDIIVRGGGDDSIYLENVTAEGIISIEKKDVRVQLQGSTTVSDIEVKEECTLSSINFTGSVDAIIISEALDENSDVTIKVPADKVIVCLLYTSGVLQYYEKVNNPENAINKVNSLLTLYNKKTRRLSLKNVFGDIRVRGGSSISVSLNLGDIQVNQYFICESVTHTFKEGMHFMDISLKGSDFYE